MAIVGPWVGSSAKAETGQAWMAAAGTALRMTTPFNMSAMIGKATEVRIVFTASNHNMNPNVLVNMIQAATGNAGPGGADLFVTINPGVQLIGAAGTFVFNFYASYFGTARSITVINHGWIFGRGGNGATANTALSHDQQQPNGGGGSHGIHIQDRLRINIDNRGVIAGGGGGGACVAIGFTPVQGAGGGGGAPFGAGGAGQNGGQNGGNASDTGGGGGAGAFGGLWAYSGAGGGLGGNGAGPTNPNNSFVVNMSSRGGASGWAVVPAWFDGNNGSVNWIFRGDIRGPSL
ncbi:hypothetical protein fHeYen901_36 [Yersinia phage fHe-Yen9-01]|uniref:Receptor-recognizing protein gp38 n=1 Tax=Yersinia phage fHe-Yen9-01 TaxID=1965363 RepID=A0A1V0DXD5_9CAUD|nr:tail fiber protein; host specificity [Yersinia phage fHe-Yen9-01]ARB05809.1 hypothetical protein fHeYen901_36 [Yersinia phage fHe-Yen9-01]